VPEAIIRRASLDDVDELVALRWEMSVEQSEAKEDRATFESRCAAEMREALADERWMVWVAKVDGRLAATIWIYAVPRVPRPWPQRPWGYVTNVFARAEYRNAGVGSRLLGRVVDWAREGELSMLLVWPSARSLSFYERQGFVPSPDALELKLLPED
jgi:GNAT superfamily N-acetyltransferase